VFFHVYKWTKPNFSKNGIGSGAVISVYICIPAMSASRVIFLRRAAPWPEVGERVDMIRRKSRRNERVGEMKQEEMRRVEEG
jgi:hypothetical protein